MFVQASTVTTPRTIDLRTRGNQHGFIRRMVSPGDIGERIKPFIFLDYVGGKVASGTGFGFHPHSGIATLTYQVNADIAYEDTTLGSYDGATNPIPAPSPMVYLDVVLNPGETWSFTPPEGHTIGWAMVYAAAALPEAP